MSQFEVGRTGVEAGRSPERGIAAGARGRANVVRFAVSALGVIVLAAALVVSVIAFLILGIGLYFAAEGGHSETVPLLHFGIPYAVSAILLAITAWCTLRKQTEWRGASFGSVAALLSGAYLLFQWPFTRRNYSWLPWAIFGIWTTMVIAGVALACLVLLWFLHRRLTTPAET